MNSAIANPCSIIAHRGARAYAPENTLAAFAKAKTLNCSMFEMDVRLAKDGKVVVHHDENVLRCTDAKDRFPKRQSYNISDFTLAELSQLDAGSWYVKQLALPSDARQPFLQSLTDDEIRQFISPTESQWYASGTIKIPTLTETLSLAKELNLRVNIELKSQPETDRILVASVLKTLQTMKLASQVLISSFTHELLRQVRQHSSSVETAVLTDKPIKAPLTYLRRLKTNAYNLAAPHDNLNSVTGKAYVKHLQKIHCAGYRINLWTCNDPDEIAQLLATDSVSGLITDYPNRVHAAMMADATSP